MEFPRTDPCPHGCDADIVTNVWWDHGRNGMAIEVHHRGRIAATLIDRVEYDFAWDLRHIYEYQLEWCLGTLLSSTGCLKVEDPRAAAAARHPRGTESSSLTA